jgi:carboxyl-terminal processing protease
VTLLESRRRAEWDQREQERLERKNRFRISQGLSALDPKQAEDQEDNEEADDAENEATNHIQLDEAARILVDSIRLTAPIAVMR